jgi:hypothetical protein
VSPWAQEERQMNTEIKMISARISIKSTFIGLTGEAINDEWWN